MTLPSCLFVVVGSPVYTRFYIFVIMNILNMEDIISVNFHVWLLNFDTLSESNEVNETFIDIHVSVYR
jgi:hypothetical protein